jgi:integrase
LAVVPVLPEAFGLEEPHRPAPNRHVPKYRPRKPKDLAVVRIDGHDHYLGKYDTPQSHENYHRLVAEWLSGARSISARTTDAPDRDGLTVNELILAYFRHSEQYYVKNGELTNQIRMIRLALRVVRRLHGTTLVAGFGPLALKACRDEFIRQGLSRRECNRRTNLVKQAFRWGTENELVPPGIFQALQAVAGLRKGRCEARETLPIGPVADDVVDRTVEHLSPTLAAMVALQRITGMRPQEVVGLRAADVDMSDASCWVYHPGRHKGEHHGKDRVVFLGPRAIEIINPYVTSDSSVFPLLAHPSRGRARPGSTSAADDEAISVPSGPETEVASRATAQGSVRRGQLPPCHRPGLRPGVPPSGAVGTRQ